MDITEPLSGIIVLDKPSALASTACLNRIKRLVPKSCKVGHAGTLDARATGVLVVLIGKATRACELIMSMPKTYDATIKLGATTATDDADSPEVPHPRGNLPVTQEQIDLALKPFVGSIPQIPPAYSALKRGGRRASDLARAGRPPALAPREVRIDSIRILQFDYPLLRVEVDCGRGTYIRSLARDIGSVVDRGGYVASLRRTRVGPFDVAQSVPLDKLVELGVRAHLRGVPDAP
jgi:tRNA pseudouridine55 synthase